MSTDHTDIDQEMEGRVVCRRRARAVVWDYFERITGDDGLPKTRCTKCNTVYSTAPKSGTSTMRRHLRKCNPQPLAQLRPTEAFTRTNTTRSSDELLNEARDAKKSKSVMEDSLQNKSDRELMEFIWRNKRNIGLLEEKLPDKARTIKEALKCYEDELDRRAKRQRHKGKNPGPGTSTVAVKIEVDDQVVARNGIFGENMAEDGSAMEGETTVTHADVIQQKTSPRFDTEQVVIKVEVEDQFVAANENSDGNIAEEESAGRLQIVAIHGDENQMAISPEDICSELRKVSSVLSMLTSPDSFYTPRDNPLDEEAEEAKQTLNELLKKDFETIVGSPNEQTVKSVVQILIRNLDKLPRFQGRVVESLHTEFESACKNWIAWHKSIQTNIAFEAQQGDNLEVLQEWQEKDTEIESRIAEVDADIVRLKAELHEKELSRERLMKQKSDMFDQSSSISMDEAKKLLQEMVAVKLQSDVAIDNLKELANKWEKIRKNFLQE
ncbi:uncharacterized protein LOC112525304 isoform X1 [Cynara cardunculus var. scolymus]|nr:uncharacterized protein LOC112525304 isoform X1 [Cynara cardunculus var. scolymus]XP_024991147.1 uncharacterized protein LOC112525304 isoform X1 [Cynara cardunculus var. scolymus]